MVTAKTGQPKELPCLVLLPSFHLQKPKGIWYTLLFIPLSSNPIKSDYILNASPFTYALYPLIMPG